MRLVVLGATGMLGHKVYQVLEQLFPGTWAVARADVRRVEPYCRVSFLQNDRVITGVDAEDLQTLKGVLSDLRPDYIVNCIGVIKQRPAAQLPIPSIMVNSLLPHMLCAFASEWGGKVIHFSTDCVFSGERGAYTEDDFSDARDLYGQSKHLGEVQESNAVTLRTSFIGRELARSDSLLEWFLSRNHSTVRGFTRVIFSGLTSLELASVVASIIQDHPKLSGLFHVVSSPISKFDLLSLIRDIAELDITIEPDARIVCDRSLRGELFAERTGYCAPPWDVMVRRMLAEANLYSEWRAGIQGPRQAPR